MSGVATAVVASSVITGYMASEAQDQAISAQNDAANKQRNAQAAAYGTAKNLYQPYADIGKTALSDLTKNQGYFQHQFGAEDLNANLAPGYAFRLGQGQKANLQANNLTGGAVSGNSLRSLQDYTQNFASGEYANAFNQYQAQRTNIYNQLSDIAKLGFTATQGQANAALGYGNNISNIAGSVGNAQAAQAIAQGNIWGNVAQGVGNAGAYYALNNMNQSNPYGNVGISGNNSSGYTYNQPVGPTESGGNLMQLRT